MLCWLPGADPATRDEGAHLSRRALALFEKHVSQTQQEFVTIAIAEIDGLEVAVVYHWNKSTAERIAGRLRKTGISASGTSGNDHAEIVLYERENGVPVIGISNSAGPCPTCKGVLWQYGRWFCQRVLGFGWVARPLRV